MALLHCALRLGRSDPIPNLSYYKPETYSGVQMGEIMWSEKMKIYAVLRDNGKMGTNADRFIPRIPRIPETNRDSPPEKSDAMLLESSLIGICFNNKNTRVLGNGILMIWTLSKLYTIPSCMGTRLRVWDAILIF